MTRTGKIIVTLKQFVRYRYAWPGGYEIHAVTADGEALCHQCTQQHLGLIVTSTVKRETDGWCVIGTDINYEDENLYCTNCNRLIEPAYRK